MKEMKVEDLIKQNKVVKPAGSLIIKKNHKLKKQIKRVDYSSFIKKRVNKLGQVKILKRYYDIDLNTATITLAFDTFEELIDKNFVGTNKQKLNNIFFDKLEECFLDLPIALNIIVNIIVKNYGDYSQAEAQEIIKENLALEILYYKQMKRRKTINSIKLMVTGALVLLLSYIISGFLNNFCNDLLNILATVFIWDGFSIYFVGRTSYRYIELRYSKKIKGIAFI